MEEAALAGIPQNLREARRKKGLCDRCGLPKHRWQWCRREISILSTRKTEKKGKGKKKKDKDDSEAAPAVTASSVALKRKPQPIRKVLESFLSPHIKEFWLTLD